MGAVLAVMLEAIASESTADQCAAIATLALLSSLDGEETISLIIPHTSAVDSRVQVAAIGALCQVATKGNEAAIAATGARLADPCLKVRKATVRAVAQLTTREDHMSLREQASLATN